MLLIACPHCGPRSELEFRWGGEADKPRPLLDCTDAEWATYLFGQRNPKGVVSERWVHAYGCRQWFIVVRDTVSHQINDTYPLGSSPAGPVERSA
jgi:sarcosine oxidase, subunit delta